MGREQRHQLGAGTARVEGAAHRRLRHPVHRGRATGLQVRDQSQVGGEFRGQRSRGGHGQIRLSQEEVDGSGDGLCHRRDRGRLDLVGCAGCDEFAARRRQGAVSHQA